jgi:hypothetical protein
MMVIAKNQNYINEEQKSSTSSRIDELGKMLNKLLQKLDSYIDKN